MTAAPINVPPSQFWDGVDGPWSTFSIQVGTPPQIVRVLPGTAETSTYVIDAAVCPDAFDLDCPKLRGGTFASANSTTYTAKGGYEVPLFWEESLGLGANATYGWDTIGLGLQDSGLPSLNQQVIGAVQTTDFYLGTLAVNPRPTNFTDQNDPQTSLLQALRNRNTSPIPSTTWSYTAGCFNCSPKVYASLVLGGYDSSRFTPNDVTFGFNEDVSADTVVSINTITTNTTDQKLLDQSVLAYITTLVPDIWLPEQACSAMEDAFGLVWDSTNEIYAINDTLHDKLLTTNPTITFDLSPQSSSNGGTAQINMPYSNLYLTASSPRTQNATRYFPVRRAANDTQYTLGRAFLQSAYLSVNYDRRTFSVSQIAASTSSLSQSLVPIYDPGTEPRTPVSVGSDQVTTSSSLSKSAIAGIASAGALTLVALLILLVFYLRRRRRGFGSPDRFEKAELDAGQTAIIVAGLKDLHEIGDIDPYEAEGDTKLRPELDGEAAVKMEIDGTGLATHYEVPAEDWPVELDAPEWEGPLRAQQPLEAEGRLKARYG